MENASKALIMAASVLIALMIIVALLLMFNNLTNYQNTGTQNTREAQIIEFNNQFVTYNKEKVRGSELYSLLNRVIDYNKRKTSEGTAEGKEIAYEPMEITFTMDNSKLSADGTNRLFKGSNRYTVNKNENTFENNIKLKIDKIEKDYGESVLQNLSTGLTKIFITPTGSTEQQKKDKIDAITNFNSAYGKEKYSISTDQKIQEAWSDIGPGGTVRKDVYTYYEYVQFKRAIFKCNDVKYNQQTGRIISMDFSFTGKFQ